MYLNREEKSECCKWENCNSKSQLLFISCYWCSVCSVDGDGGQDGSPRLGSSHRCCCWLGQCCFWIHYTVAAQKAAANFWKAQIYCEWQKWANGTTLPPWETHYCSVIHKPHDEWGGWGAACFYRRERTQHSVSLMDVSAALPRSLLWQSSKAQPVRSLSLMIIVLINEWIYPLILS